MPNLTRRQALQAATGALTLPSPLAGEGPGVRGQPPSDLAALWAARCGVAKTWEILMRTAEGSPQERAAFDRLDRLDRRIACTPARSLADVLTKLRFLAHYQDLHLPWAQKTDDLEVKALLTAWRGMEGIFSRA